ncbi:hypothetical protein CHUAL_007959 [Chamberlinius hualienensis]
MMSKIITNMVVFAMFLVIFGIVRGIEDVNEDPFSENEVFHGIEKRQVNGTNTTIPGITTTVTTLSPNENNTVSTTLTTSNVSLTTSNLTTVSTTTTTTRAPVPPPNPGNAYYESYDVNANLEYIYPF